MSEGELARVVGVTRQAVGQALKKGKTGEGCTFLPDMLRAVGESELLAFPGLNDAERLALDTVHDIARDMSLEEALKLLELFAQQMRGGKK